MSSIRSLDSGSGSPASAVNAATSSTIAASCGKPGRSTSRSRSRMPDPPSTSGTGPVTVSFDALSDRR